MKSDVETLSPTRVRLSIEVPFDELKPMLDDAYRTTISRPRAASPRSPAATAAL